MVKILKSTQNSCTVCTALLRYLQLVTQIVVPTTLATSVTRGTRVLPFGEGLQAPCSGFLIQLSVKFCALNAIEALRMSNVPKTRSHSGFSSSNLRDACVRLSNSSRMLRKSIVDAGPMCWCWCRRRFDPSVSEGVLVNSVSPVYQIERTRFTTVRSTRIS